MTEAASLASLVAINYISYVADGTLGDPANIPFVGDYAGITSADNNFDSFPIWTDVRSGTASARTMDLCYSDCYTFLQPYTPILAGFSSPFTDLYQLNTDASFGGSGGPFWTAVGIREGADGTSVDDDMVLYGNRYYQTVLTSSSASPPVNDYVLINGNVAPSQPYFPQVHSSSNQGGTYSIEWVPGSLSVANGSGVADIMGPNNVIRVYDTFLNTGTLYYVGVRPEPGGNTDFSLQLHSASRGNEQGYGNNVASSGRVGVGNPAFVSYNTGADPSQRDAIVVQNNNGGAPIYTVYVDNAVPTGTISINSGAAATNNAAVSLTLSATTANAGDPVMDMRFSNDGVTFGAWQPYTTNASYTLPSGDGNKTVYVEYRNGAGGISSAVPASILLDSTAPVTMAALGGHNTLCGQFFSPVTVTLSATDPAPGSGIAATTYQLDGGPVATYTAPFQVTAVGSHTVTFHSTDNAGNVESMKSVSFTIVAPSVTVAPSSGIVGSSTTVTGSNFRKGETVRVFWDSTSGTLLGTFIATSTCGLSASVVIPHATKGSHSLIALGANSNTPVSAPFTVLPALVMSPTLGHAGSSATVTVTGYGNGEGVTVKWNCATSGCGSTTVLATGMTSSTGDFSAIVTIPSTAAPGPYTVGGIGNAGTFTSVLYQVVTFSNLAWTTGAAVSRPHLEGAAATTGGKIYVMDGGTTDLSEGGVNTATNTLDIYTPATDAWSAGPAPIVARNAMPLAATVNGKIYLIGGTNTGGTARAIEMFNPATNSWMVLPGTANLPDALDGANHCGAVLGSKMYYFESSGVGVFDTTTDTWTVLAASPLLTPSLYCQAVATGSGTIAITGPGDGTSGSNSQRILYYTAATNSVITLQARTNPLGEHSFAILNSQGVATGGDFGGTAAQIIPVGARFAINATPLPTAREDAVSAMVSGRLYILGGRSGTNTIPPVLIGAPIG
jgi:hypothetical protein